MPRNEWPLKARSGTGTDSRCLAASAGDLRFLAMNRGERWFAADPFGCRLDVFGDGMFPSIAIGTSCLVRAYAERTPSSSASYRVVLGGPIHLDAGLWQLRP